jgi:hypothetical protein
MIGWMPPRTNQNSGHWKAHTESIANTRGRPAGLGTLTHTPRIDAGGATAAGSATEWGRSAASSRATAAGLTTSGGPLTSGWDELSSAGRERGGPVTDAEGQIGQINPSNVPDYLATLGAHRPSEMVHSKLFQCIG